MKQKQSSSLLLFTNPLIILILLNPGMQLSFIQFIGASCISAKLNVLSLTLFFSDNLIHFSQEHKSFLSPKFTPFALYRWHFMGSYASWRHLAMVKDILEFAGRQGISNILHCSDDPPTNKLARWQRSVMEPRMGNTVLAHPLCSWYYYNRYYNMKSNSMISDFKEVRVSLKTKPFHVPF